MKMLPIIVTIIASVFAIYLYHIVPNYLINITNNKIGYNLYKFFNGKYLVDNIYNYYIIYGGLNIGNIISLKIDLGLIELLGPYGLSTSLQSSSKTISLIDTGSVQNYALYIIVATVSIIFIVFTQVMFNYSIIISLVFIVTIISILITILLK
jgi:NADH-ubiquinone oxidoreductase chain 5